MGFRGDIVHKMYIWKWVQTHFAWSHHIDLATYCIRSRHSGMRCLGQVLLLSLWVNKRLQVCSSILGRSCLHSIPLCTMLVQIKGWLIDCAVWAVLNILHTMPQSQSAIARKFTSKTVARNAVWSALFRQVMFTLLYPIVHNAYCKLKDDEWLW